MENHEYIYNFLHILFLQVSADNYSFIVYIFTISFYLYHCIETISMLITVKNNK